MGLFTVNHSYFFFYFYYLFLHRMATNRKLDKDVQILSLSGRAADMVGTELVDTVSVSADFKTVLSTGSRLIVVVSLSANEQVSCNNEQGRCGSSGKMN